MGLFSIYTGLIYNDVFSKSLNVFGSSWRVNNLTLKNVNDMGAEHALNPMTTHDYTGTPYPIGLDPAWQLAKNKIIFQNSFKMKISIIIGIIHMLFGVMVSLFNHM